MKIMERFQKIIHTEDGTGVKVRKALGLDITASDADVLAAINAKKAAIEAAKSAAALDRTLVKYSIGKHAKPRTETNVFADRARTYLSKSAETAYEAHRRTVEEAAAVELKRMQKVSARDVGVASERPKVSSGVDSFDVDNPKSAYAQLKEIAAQVRAASGKLTEAQAFEAVYSDARYKDLVARERAERFAGARYLDDDEIPEL